MAATGAASISVVIPTRDRPDRLTRCLDALEAQTAIEDIEIVVVDDGSTDATAVEAAAARPRVRLIRQRPAGPAAARNTGARAAGGTFLCFTDDDCEPEPKGVERLTAPPRGGAPAAAGRTITAAIDNPFD